LVDEVVGAVSIAVVMVDPTFLHAAMATRSKRLLADSPERAISESWNHGGRFSPFS
jgi:hypothetical protein